jgi:hypothetical protein
MNKRKKKTKTMNGQTSSKRLSRLLRKHHAAMKKFRAIRDSIKARRA